jgi:hypothetical protein
MPQFILEPVHIIPYQLYCQQIKDAHEKMKCIDEKGYTFSGSGLTVELSHMVR